MKFYTTVDLELEPLLNLVLEPIGADPGAVEGRIYYSTVLNTVRFYDGSDWISLGSGTGDGTVTSVGLVLPTADFLVSGSPVTTSGSLTAAWKTKAPNFILAGPTSGADAVPAFRSLVDADIPAGIARLTDIPSALPPNGTAGGDLSGSYPNPVVDGLQNRAIAATAPSDGEALIWVDASSHWAPGSVSAFTNPLSVHGIRVSHVGEAQALFVPWVTGDTAPTVVVGSIASGNDQTALYAQSDSAPAIYGVSNTGPGLAAISNAIGMTSSGYGGYAASLRRFVTDDDAVVPVLALYGTTVSTTTDDGFGAGIDLWARAADDAEYIIGRITAEYTSAASLHSSMSFWVAHAGVAAIGMDLSDTGDLTIAGDATVSGTLFAAVGGDISGTVAAATVAKLQGRAVAATAPTDGQALVWVDASSHWAPGTITPGTGTVTSVALTVPAFLSVAGSPVTTSGTLAVTLATQSANTVFAGPASGSAAAPTFRALVALDIPNPLNAHGVRTAIGSNAAGLYVPWITGDTLPTLVVGASTSGNNQTAVTGISDSLTGVYGQSTSGSGVNGTSTSSTGVVANSTSGNAIVATNASASCIVATNSDTATNTTPFGFNLRHGTSATPVAGFGESLALQLHDAGNTYRTAGTMTAIWTDPLAVSFTSALTFATASAAGAQAERMRITGIGQLLLRSTDATQAAGGYLPWVSGDALPTLKVGSSTSGNNQVGVQGISDSSTGVLGQSASGIAVRGTGTGNIGVLAESNTGTPLIATRNSSTTNNTTDAVLLRATLSSGTAANGFGSNFGFQANTNGSTNRDQARFAALWTDATDATRTSALAFYTANSASLAERMRITGAGQLLLRSTSASAAAGMYVPWITGDTLTTLSVGSTSGSNDQIGLTVTSGTVNAIFAQNTSGSVIVSASVDAGTNNIPVGLNTRHGSSGTPAAGFGSGLLFQMHDAGNTYRSAIQISAIWTDPLAVSFTAALTFATANAAGALAEKMRLTGIGQLLLRTTSGSVVAGLYVPWVSGDALTTARFGSSTSGNNQNAIESYSDSAYGVQGQSTSNTGVYGVSTSAAGVVGQTASATFPALYAAKPSATDNAVTAIFDLHHNATGGSSTGFGAAINTFLKTTTTADQAATRIGMLWTDATHATRTSAIAFWTVNSAAAIAEQMRLTGPGALWIGRTSGGLTGAGDLDITGDFAMADAKNISFGTSTGTQIGTATGQKLSFHGAAPSAQGAAITAPTGGLVADTEARTAINTIITFLQTKGLTA
jgi:hypothetical protein